MPATCALQNSPFQFHPNVMNLSRDKYLPSSTAPGLVLLLKLLAMSGAVAVLFQALPAKPKPRLISSFAKLPLRRCSAARSWYKVREKPRLQCQVLGHIMDAAAVQAQSAQTQLHVWLEAERIPALSWQLPSVSSCTTLTDPNPIPSPSLASSSYYFETQISCPVSWRFQKEEGNLLHQSNSCTPLSLKS